MTRIEEIEAHIDAAFGEWSNSTQAQVYWDCRSLLPMVKAALAYQGKWDGGGSEIPDHKPILAACRAFREANTDVTMAAPSPGDLGPVVDSGAIPGSGAAGSGAEGGGRSVNNPYRIWPWHLAPPEWQYEGNGPDEDYVIHIPAEYLIDGAVPWTTEWMLPKDCIENGHRDYAQADGSVVRVVRRT